MLYNYITTKKGQELITDVRKGTLVLCRGEWKPCPKPEVIKAYRYTFHTLPTTILPYSDMRIMINTRPKLNKSDVFMPQLSVRGFYGDNRTEKLTFGNKEIEWIYPRIIRYYERAAAISFEATGKYSVTMPKKNVSELSNDELSERNLEYYLEGLLRYGGSPVGNKYEIPVRNETDKMVLRLLGLELSPYNRFNKRLPVITERTMLTLFSHIKDDWCKGKFKDEFVAYHINHKTKLPKYIGIHKEDLIDIESVEVLGFPDFDYDVNGINIGDFVK